MHPMQYQIQCATAQLHHSYNGPTTFNTFLAARSAARIACRGVQGHHVNVLDGLGVTCYSAILPRVISVAPPILEVLA